VPENQVLAQVVGGFLSYLNHRVQKGRGKSAWPDSKSPEQILFKGKCRPKSEAK
jgi:hypothetical protein